MATYEAQGSALAAVGQVAQQRAKAQLADAAWANPVAVNQAILHENKGEFLAGVITRRRKPWHCENAKKRKRKKKKGVMVSVHACMKCVLMHVYSCCLCGKTPAAMTAATLDPEQLQIQNGYLKTAIFFVGHDDGRR